MHFPLSSETTNSTNLKLLNLLILLVPLRWVVLSCTSPVAIQSLWHSSLQIAYLLQLLVDLEHLLIQRE